MPNQAEGENSQAGLPTPPLRLRRIHLQGVGPDLARFDPLDLDFTTSSGAASRVLLSLVNTGGKSTLITLLSSLVVPASRLQVGGKSLGDYVLTGDTSHIVCEWEDSTSGVRVVTGTVMEWKDGRRQPPYRMRSTTAMHRAWYLFRTGGNLPGISDLPFVVAGRRLPYKDFRAAVHDLIGEHDAARGILTDRQQDWIAALEDHTSIDPTLFGYQMRMNDSEAGAEKLLTSFDSPDNVVRFFIAALNDDRELVQFTANLEQYAALAGQRSTLESRFEFGCEIAPMIDLIVHRGELLTAAESEVTRARIAGGTHVSALANRVNADRATLGELDAAVDAAGKIFAAARREYGQISDIRKQLLLEEARARVADAEHDLEIATARAGKAEDHHQAWLAVDDVVDLATKRKAAEGAQLAYNAADAGLGPQRIATASTAAQLAGRLDGLVREAGNAADEAGQAAENAKEEGEQARDSQQQARARLSKLDAELERLNELITTAERVRANAATEGWLDSSESPADCVRRWQEVRRTATFEAEQAAGRENEANGRFEQLGRELDEIDEGLVGRRSRAQSAAARLDAYRADMATVVADDTVCELAGDSPQNAASLARVVEIAQISAAAAQVKETQHRTAEETAREELAHLDETGTAPTGPDVLAVLAVLQDGAIGSVTGLNWIEHNITQPASRESFITSHPQLAGGVIVTDPRRFDDATQALSTSSLRTRTPITVTTIPTTTASDSVSQVRRHIVVPHRATWDRQWAAEVRQELEATAARHGQAAAGAAAAAHRYRRAESLCRRRCAPPDARLE